MDSILKIITGAVKLLGSSGNQIGSKGDRLKVEASFADDYTTTAIGALRTAATQNVFESLFSFDKQPLIWDEALSGGATSVFNANTNSVEMTLPTTSGASVVRQTFRRIRYNPSRTVQVLIAATLGAAKTNVRKRSGQFDETDGFFFEQTGTGIAAVKRSSTSGSVVDTVIPQASWNIDKFDGTGPSGVTIDFTKHQLFYIQYAFQGFGDIVFGFYANGRVLFAHRMAVANIEAVPSCKTAHLPIRLEMTNTATSASPTVTSYNSAALKNEGEDANQEGQIRSYSGLPLKTVGTTEIPIMSIRLGAGFLKAIVDILKTSILVQTADEVIWTIKTGATLTGATFAVTGSYTEIDTAATAITGGVELVSGLLSDTSSSADVSENLLKLTNSLLGVSIGNVPTVITLSARSRIGTADILSTIVWREFP